MVAPRIVLASSSRYRRELLERLRIPFEIVSPQIDESAQHGERSADLALRLARAKALVVAAVNPDAIVIGSDQVADLEGISIGKPLTHASALMQLEQMQGKTVVFHSALAVAWQGGQHIEVDSVPTRVRYRRRTRAELNGYLLADTPYDCAGSAKIESLGIALLEEVHTDDPTALIGLPLIRLVSMLEQAGLHLLANA